MIEALSCIGFTSPHPEHWSSFGPDLLGLGLAEAGADGAVRLRVDDAPWRVAIHPGERDDVAYLGWSVPGADELAAVTERLLQAGVEVHREHDVLARAREAAAVASFVDPFGFRHEPSHSLAFTAIPGMRGFHHLMLEVSDYVQVEAAWQRVRDRGLPVAMTLGKHTNDEMYSFYVRTPSGFEIEYGSGGKIIETAAPWTPGHYDAMSSWGHERLSPPMFPGILAPAAGVTK